jgi:hypothetical protein
MSTNVFLLFFHKWRVTGATGHHTAAKTNTQKNTLIGQTTFRTKFKSNHDKTQLSRKKSVQKLFLSYQTIVRKRQASLTSLFLFPFVGASAGRAVLCFLQLVAGIKLKPLE